MKEGDNRKPDLNFAESPDEGGDRHPPNSHPVRPTRVRVDLDQLAQNYRAIQHHIGLERGIMPILKANAYGHGLVPVARRMAKEGAPILGVAYLEEGLLLRNAGIQTPILVLGGLVGEQIPQFLHNDLILTVSSLDKLRAVQACARETGLPARVHLKIDTGMERVGVHWYTAERLLAASMESEGVVVEGIYSHLANSDSRDPEPTRRQLERFQAVLSIYDRYGVSRPKAHLANSGAILQYPETWLDLVRPGILLYGQRPDPEIPLTVPVRSAMRWTTQVVYFKVVPAGNPVGYGSTWSPPQNTRVVTIPVGYGDGYLRAMSGQAEVLIRGQRFPVVGRICMDQAMVDIGQASAWNGDEVTLLGPGDESSDIPAVGLAESTAIGSNTEPTERHNREIQAEELARWAGTIVYEILTNINTRVPRIYRETT
jgi:alanine racemase